MSESGELTKIIEKHSKENLNCQTSKGKPLGFENIAIIFVIISVGAAASLILFSLEWIFRRTNEGREKKYHVVKKDASLS